MMWRISATLAIVRDETLTKSGLNIHTEYVSTSTFSRN